LGLEGLASTQSSVTCSSENDPANECLVTGLFRIALGKDQKTLFGAATTGLFWSSSRKPEEFYVFA